MSVNLKNLQLWIVTEGMAGTENQCLGIAEALGIQPVVHRVTLRGLWRYLSPWIPFETASMFSPPLNGPWPDILIASGRKSIAAARYIKRMSGGETIIVQVQDPRISPRWFDLVAVPVHDPARGDNVIVTQGAPNRITPDTLARARDEYASLFAMIPAPRVAVLLGGNSKAHTMTSSAMEKLGEQLSSLDGSLIITASRRTPPDAKAAFVKGLGHKPHWLWDGTGPNPYHGMLAWADHILVTADSVSMLSDAATTGKPVSMIALDGGSKRFDRFYQGMIESGAARWFDGTLPHWTYPPFRDSNLIAERILELLKKS